jgi:hypothetical protein
MPESFFEHDEQAGLHRATELTRGPWDPGAQHAGPPAALIAREIERLGGGTINGAPAQVGRITYEVLRPIPIAPLRVGAEVLRPGRRVEMVGATLTDSEGVELMRARGWRIRTAEVAFEAPPGLPTAPPGPQRGEPREFVLAGRDEEDGYPAAMEHRFISGSFMEAGPATVWMRMKVPLLAGEEPSPLQRVLVAADSGNGVSSALDWRRYVFINVDLSVHLHRMPRGSGSASTR